tara:strand:- start:9301 stop:9471 length:171 start_codon:yes stop_codon:yes gene_type:complete
MRPHLEDKKTRINKLREKSPRFLLNELGWDYDRLTTDGQEIYDVLAEKILKHKIEI